MELIARPAAAGRVNVVNGFGLEAGKPLASSSRVNKVAFTGETTTGRLIMQYASQNIIPVTLELGGKSPNIFFADVLQADDAFFDKSLEGFAMFALNQGEVCTCPSRALIQESIYDQFMERAIKRVKAIKQANPLDKTTMLGAQASSEQMEKILSYLDIGKQEGAETLIGGKRASLDGDLAEGFYIEPTIFKGHNKMRIFQEEIFGPVVSVTTLQGRGRGAGTGERHALRSWAPAYGRGTSTARIAWAAASRPAACGPTAITCIQRTRLLAATSSRASDARTISRCWTTTSRPRISSSATARTRWASSR